MVDIEEEPSTFEGGGQEERERELVVVGEHHTGVSERESCWCCTEEVQEDSGLLAGRSTTLLCVAYGFDVAACGCGAALLRGQRKAYK